MKNEEIEEREKFYLDALGHLQKLDDSVSRLSNSIEQHQYFVQGIALGLFYGIIGNIVISHYYGVFEGLELSKFDTLFWSNLLVFVVGLAFILAISGIWYSKLKRLKSSQNKVSLIKNLIEDERKYEEDSLEELRKLKEEKRKEGLGL